VKPADPYKANAEARAQAAADRAARNEQPPQTWKETVRNGKPVLVGSNGDIKEIPGVDKNDGELNPGQKNAIANEAIQKLKLIESLDKRSREGWFATGFGAETMADWFPASNAGSVKADVDTVGAAGALQRIMEMAQTNGGKNPLTPLSNADFVALGQSISNLDPTRNDETFQKNLKAYADIYRRALLGVGIDPKTLDQPIQDYLATLPAPVTVPGTEPTTPPPAAPNNAASDPAGDEYRARLGRGESAGQIMAWLKSQGREFNPAQVRAAVEFRRLHPNAPLESYYFETKLASPVQKAPETSGVWGKAREVQP